MSIYVVWLVLGTFCCHWSICGRLLPLGTVLEPSVYAQYMSVNVACRYWLWLSAGLHAEFYA